MSGGKGGSTTSEVTIPAWLESAARQNIARADEIAQIGYVPYYGPDVAAMTPMQMAAGDNIGAAASAFGLAGPTSTGAGMPTAMDYGGMGAYSSAPLYEQSLAELQQRAPGQFEALRAPFIDPVTGARPAAPFGGGSNDRVLSNLADTISQIGQSRESNESYTPPMRQDRDGRAPSSFASSSFRAALPGGVNDPYLERPVNQAVASAMNSMRGEPTSSLRPVARPNPSERNSSSGMGGGK